MVNDPGVGSPVVRIHIEIEAAHREHAAVTGDRVVNQTCAGPCDAEHNVARRGIDQSGLVILRDESDRTVIGQSHSVHSKTIRPRSSDRASGSIKDIESLILSYGIAHDS